jgi:hypothetical protein
VTKPPAERNGFGHPTPKTGTGHGTETAAAVPHVINPRAVYDLRSATAALELNRTTLLREVRKRRLRVSRRGGRYFVLGAWLLQWLKEGEIPRRRPAHAGVGEDT